MKLLFATTKSIGRRSPHPDAIGRAERSEVAEEVIQSDANIQGWHTAELWDDGVSALREHQVSPKQENPTRDDIYRMGALDADGDALLGEEHEIAAGVSLPRNSRRRRIRGSWATSANCPSIPTR